MGDGSVYEPPAVDLETETQAHVLGGSGSVPASDESVKERRRRILQATLSRLKEEEEEIETSWSEDALVRITCSNHAAHL
jgi:hypothetical protein